MRYSLSAQLPEVQNAQGCLVRAAQCSAPPAIQCPPFPLSSHLCFHHFSMFPNTNIYIYMSIHMYMYICIHMCSLSSPLGDTETDQRYIQYHRGKWESNLRCSYQATVLKTLVACQAALAQLANPTTGFTSSCICSRTRTCDAA